MPTIVLEPVIVKPESQSRVDALTERVRIFEIATSADYVAAGEVLKDVKKEHKTRSDFFAPNVKKAHEAHKEAKRLQNIATAPLRAIEFMLNLKMSNYRTEEKRKRREEQARQIALQRKRQEDDQLAAAQATKDAGDPLGSEAILNQKLAAPPPVVVPSTVPKVAGVHSRTRWTYRIVNEAQVPRALCSPDSKKLNSHVTAHHDSQPVAGVEFYAKDDTVART